MSLLMSDRSVRGEGSGRLASPPVPVGKQVGTDVIERLGHLPVGVMRLRLGEVAHVADVLALAVLVDVLVLHPLATPGFGPCERFQHRATVPAAAAEVVDLPRPW